VLAVVHLAVLADCQTAFLAVTIFCPSTFGLTEHPRTKLFPWLFWEESRGLEVPAALAWLLFFLLFSLLF